jgi:hypothetical protein
MRKSVLGAHPSEVACFRSKWEVRACPRATQPEENWTNRACRTDRSRLLLRGCEGHLWGVAARALRLHASGMWPRRSAIVTAPRRIASLANRSRRFASSVPTANLSNRFARCCFTAAWLITSSSAIVRVDAGSVNISRAKSGRHSATRTSRSRVVRDGGASSDSVSGSAAPVDSRKNRRVCPMRISSSWRTRCNDQMRSPFSHVPLDDPTSVTHQPAGKRSKTAWRWLTAGSSSAMSFSEAVPTVMRPNRSSTRALRWADTTSIAATMRHSVREAHGAPGMR